jgi:copper chaperone CopZ
MSKSKAEFKIGGMTCEGCVRSIELKLAAMPGVGYAHVNLGAGAVTVEYDDAQATPEQLIAAVKQIGFEATQI